MTLESETRSWDDTVSNVWYWLPVCDQYCDHLLDFKYWKHETPRPCEEYHFRQPLDTYEFYVDVWRNFWSGRTQTTTRWPVWPTHPDRCMSGYHKCVLHSVVQDGKLPSWCPPPVYIHMWTMWVWEERWRPWRVRVIEITTITGVWVNKERRREETSYKQQV